MARSRNIKPGFFKNEHLGSLPPLTRLLFAGLWGQADRTGTLEDRPMRLKAELLPYDNCVVDDMLRDLADSPEEFIVRYEVDGKKFIYIPSFLDHQNPHKAEKPAGFPPPPGVSTDKTPCKNCAGTVQEPGENKTNPKPASNENSSSRADSLNLITDSCNLIPSESSRVDHLDFSSKDLEIKVLDCAKRLFSKPAFAKKTDEDREFLLKVATLRVLERLPESCVQEGLEAIRRRGAGLPDKPVAYLTTVMSDWMEQHGSTTLAKLLVGVEVPAGLKRAPPAT